jgi:hypothetical protein
LQLSCCSNPIAQLWTCIQYKWIKSPIRAWGMNLINDLNTNLTNILNHHRDREEWTIQYTPQHARDSKQQNRVMSSLMS